MTSIGAMIRREIPPVDLAGHAQALEQGLDELWVVEDLTWAGGVSQLTAVLAATDRIVVGHGIAPAPFRNPAALAMEWATLAQMFPGRVAGGIGHGLSSWMKQIGASVESPLTLLAETLDAVRGLLAGRTVDLHGRYVQLDDVTLRWPPQLVPPVSAGVMGPRSLRLAGAHADGTILPEGHGPAEVRAARDLIEQGRADAGRSEPHRLTVFAGFYCGDLDELGPPPPEAPPGWAALGEEPSVVIDGMNSLVEAGADAVILVPFGDDPIQQLALAAADIVPLIDRS